MYIHTALLPPNFTALAGPFAKSLFRQKFSKVFSILLVYLVNLLGL
jgi:hypothetical protein